MLNKEQLSGLITKVNDYISREITFRNETGTLADFLQIIKFNSGPIVAQKNRRAQKILIVGQTEIRENVIVGIFKQAGISKDRIELISDYDKVAKQDFTKYKYNDKYVVILVGPTPHSGVNKGKYSSIVRRLENEDGFAPTVRLNANSRLKVTNSNLTKCLDELIAQGVIIQNL